MNEVNVITGADAHTPALRAAAGRPGWRAPRSTLGLGLAAGVGASLCCLPILFILLGAGGAWLGTLTALTPYRPIFLGLTAVFLALSFRKLYLVPRACDADGTCATPRTLRRQRAMFWAIAALVGLLIGIPWYSPYLLG